MENSKSFFTPIEENLKLIGEYKGKAIDPTYYKSFIKSLRYLKTTRPNIVFEVGLLNRFMEGLHACHLQVGKEFFDISNFFFFFWF